MMPPKQLLTIILIVFSTLSFIKLLLLTSSSSSAASSSSAHSHGSAWDGGGGGNGTGRSVLAAKELVLLRSLVAARAPCRLLVFGLSPQLLALAALNSGPGAGAATTFVTDSAEDADGASRVLLSGSGAGAAPAVAVHRARYRDAAREAWPLLRRARGSPACRRPTGTVRKSGCPLALTSLPREVLDARWDVIVVDGPSGAAPGEPGRMGTIYTAAALARAAAAAAARDGGGEVDVAVHDVDRTVEQWYTWEYLCEDNLVAAKGRLWHFRIAAGGPPDAFCSTHPIRIL
ncbi:arabinogalactan O-methyltransferase 2-like [Phragmites australis]|uniref:arabinogalactan O-methyltransferase 2-like n=1 Tax=Phragmites australis TaxID=29695 RepID=UPI002D77D3E6|nr:arabinogalactan O-methyltransferase 2-like [Phragmites australis]